MNIYICIYIYLYTCIYIYVYLMILWKNWDGLTVLCSLIHKMLQFLGRQATREKQDNNPQNQRGFTRENSSVLMETIWKARWCFSGEISSFFLVFFFFQIFDFWDFRVGRSGLLLMGKDAWWFWWFEIGDMMWILLFFTGIIHMGYV